MRVKFFCFSQITYFYVAAMARRITHKRARARCLMELDQNTAVCLHSALQIYHGNDKLVSTKRASTTINFTIVKLWSLGISHHVMRCFTTKWKDSESFLHCFTVVYYPDFGGECVYLGTFLPLKSTVRSLNHF